MDSPRDDFHLRFAHQITAFEQIALFQLLQRLSGGAHQATGVNADRMGEAAKVLEYDVAFSHGPWRRRQARHDRILASSPYVRHGTVEPCAVNPSEEFPKSQRDDDARRASPSSSRFGAKHCSSHKFAPFVADVHCREKRDGMFAPYAEPGLRTSSRLAAQWQVCLLLSV